MGNCMIAQGKTPISSESVERNEFVEKDIIRYREEDACMFGDREFWYKKYAVQIYCVFLYTSYFE